MTFTVPGALSALREGLDRYRTAVAVSPVGGAFRPVIEWSKRIGLMSSQIRYVLTIGDDGATLIKFQGQQVVDAMFVGLEADDPHETLRSYLLEDPQARLLVSADVLEQMYREEVLPKVGRWDRRSIVKRRLDIAFPHDRLKAAVSLGRGKVNASSVLFTALPATATIENWIVFLESLPNPILGFCLLPLESAGLAARLSPSAEGEERRVWRALVSQQATSGFRQIFESEGRLVVTRLTQCPPGELTATAGAMLIERELRSSISYIKRLGYTDLDRLDLVVLANQEICQAVEVRELPVTTLTAMTPRQAGKVLGFGEVGPEDSPFADVLHAQNLARQRRPNAVLATEKLGERLKIDLAFQVSFFAAAIISLVAVLNLGAMGLDAFDTMTTAETLQQTIDTETQVLGGLRQKTKSYPIAIDDLVAVGQADDAYAKEQVSPTDIMRAVARELDPSDRVQRISFTAPNALPTSPGRQPVANARPPARGGKGDDVAYEVSLTLRLRADAAAPPEQSVLRAKDIKERLARALPGHEVTLVQLPGSGLRSQVLEGLAGASQPARDTGPPLAQYLIRKRR